MLIFQITATQGVEKYATPEELKKRLSELIDMRRIFKVEYRFEPEKEFESYVNQNKRGNK